MADVAEKRLKQRKTKISKNISETDVESLTKNVETKNVETKNVETPDSENVETPENVEISENLESSKETVETMEKVKLKPKPKKELVILPAKVKVEKNMDSYIMYFRTVQSSAIRTLSEALREVLTDTNIHFDSTGFRIMSMDQDKCAFVHLKLDADKFEDFYCPYQFTIGVNMISLYKLLKTIGNSDIVSMYITKDNEHRLGIKIENKEKKIISSSKLHLLDLDNAGLSIPTINFESIFDVPCVDFQKHIRDLTTISEVVSIYTRANGNIFVLVADGDFASQTISIGEEDALDKFNKNETENLIDEDDITKCKDAIFIGKYQLKYLNVFNKSSGMCPSAEIYLKEGYPVIISFSVSSLGKVKYGLSTYIES